MRVISYGEYIRPHKFICNKCESVIEYVNYEPKLSSYNGTFYLTCPVCGRNNTVKGEIENDN